MYITILYITIYRAMYMYIYSSFLPKMEHSVLASNNGFSIANMLVNIWVFMWSF